MPYIAQISLTNHVMVLNPFEKAVDTDSKLLWCSETNSGAEMYIFQKEKSIFFFLRFSTLGAGIEYLQHCNDLKELLN